MLCFKSSDIIEGEINYIPRKTKSSDPATVKVPLNDRAKNLWKNTRVLTRKAGYFRSYPHKNTMIPSRSFFLYVELHEWLRF